jgi:lysophospholipase L1-like esterase
VPLALFGLVELGLRIAGYGGDYPLFIESAESARYLEPNPDLMTRYFADGFAPALAIETNYFLKDKPADGLRVFVQGGSTAAGFPIGAGASIAGMLGARLRQSFPERPVEVVDTALAAVSSYALLDFADEIVAQSPDAIVIYAGHNEYLGIFGVGSAYAPTGSRTATLVALELDGLRLYQLVRNLYARTRMLVDEPTTPDATTLMAAIVRDRDIALGSARYRQGIAQFQRNMTRLIGKYRAAGVPVFVATVASNVADQPPFASSALPETIARELEAPLAAVEAGRPDAVGPETLARLETLAAEHASADLHFAAARIREERGDHEAARRHYGLARDHDRLRFRAPAAINDVIRTLARADGVHLVDANARLETAADDGLIGATLMLEHLHPTVEGYFLIADELYRALHASAELGPLPRYVASEAAQREIPVLPAEEYFARAAVAHLRSDFPFAAAPREPELPPIASASDELGYALYAEAIDWHEMAEASRGLAADPLARATAAKLIADRRPFRADLNFRAGADLLAADRPSEAVRYLQRAIEHGADRRDYGLALAEAYRLQGRSAEAIDRLDSILALDPDNAAALEARRALEP